MFFLASTCSSQQAVLNRGWICEYSIVSASTLQRGLSDCYAYLHLLAGIRYM